MGKILEKLVEIEPPHTQIMWNKDMVIESPEWLAGMTYDEYKEMMGEPEPTRERTTCWTCTDNDKCEYAWDWYNTDGDCLAIK